MEASVNQLGYFGNIWVRSHHLKAIGDTNGGGHKHHFDHVTLLSRGTIRVEVEGYPPKEFSAPTFVVIKKEHKHRITAVTDDCLYYCVFALRDIDGNVTDIYSGDNSPYDSADDDDLQEKLMDLDSKTTTENTGV